MRRPNRQHLIRSLAACLTLLALACGGSSPAAAPANIDIAREWVSATPQSQGVDEAALAGAYSGALSASPGLQSLVVVRNGLLLREQYFGGTNVATLHDVRSVTKSVMSLLVGIAIAKGTLPGADETLPALIHPPVAQVGADKAAIKIDHLLTMTGGFQWDESTAAGYNDWILSPNQVDYVLAKPLSDAPGTWFQYNSAAVHLLSVGLGEASGNSTLSYADANLFAPLGITRREWEQDAQGHENGGAGLALCARDLARIGQLVLQKGVSGSTQVVPSAWVANELAVHWTPNGSLGPLNHLQYGYLFWLASARGHSVAFAWGYRGQFIFLVPDLHLVIVATSALDNASLNAEDEAAATMGVIVNGVLPAVR